MIRIAAIQSSLPTKSCVRAKDAITLQPSQCFCPSLTSTQSIDCRGGSSKEGLGEGIALCQYDTTKYILGSIALIGDSFSGKYMERLMFNADVTRPSTKGDTVRHDD